MLRPTDRIGVALFAVLRGQIMSCPGSASVHLRSGVSWNHHAATPDAVHPGARGFEPRLERAGGSYRAAVYVKGQIKFQGEQEVAPSALPDRPLASGDRLATERDGRAELALGSATLRLDESTAVTVADLDASAVRLELAEGAASLHLYELLQSETFEVVTLNTTIAFREPGEYRVDITPSGATELSVRAGKAEVATAGGPVRVADGQRVRLEGRAEVASLVTPRAADAFDEWVLEREVLLAESAPDQSSDAYWEETLDDYGEWSDDPSYGQSSMPSYAYGGYDPFSYGYWEQSGIGWSWYDPMPWSAYTFHHGTGT